MYPYVAPHTAKIHTLITLGIRDCAKALVFQLRKHRPGGFDSHRPLHFPATAGHAGVWLGVKALIRWESLGNLTLRGRGLIASRIPALPRDSHVQSHAAILKNNLRDSQTALLAMAIAGGWTRPGAGVRERLLIDIHLLRVPPSWHPTRPPVFRRELLFRLPSLAAKNAGRPRLK